MKVLYVSYEVAPIYKFGGLGDVAGTLPKALAKLGIDIRIGMPCYADIKPVATLPASRIPMIFAQDADLFPRLNNEKGDPKHGSVGFAYFARKLLDEVKRQKFVPDIIHCNDWHTGVIPLLLKTENDPFFASTKVILTIHNSNYQGVFPIKYVREHKKTAAIAELFNAGERKFVNYLRTGIMYADYITTVSPHFAKEILDKKFGFGIGGLIRKRRRKFVGILNGIDYTRWNTQRDSYLPHTFSKKNAFAAKAANKSQLQQSLGLTVDAEVPLYGMIARITWQKGFDIVIPLLRQLAKLPVHVVILGSGDKGISQELQKQAKRFGNINVDIDFDEKLAHRIYAASDFFLIPSIFEPCGLTQMIAMAYGTIPIASAVGGLVDSITDGKTGYLFPYHSTASLLYAIKRSLTLYQNKAALIAMQQNVLSQDFSWDKSAREYQALYKSLVE